ncbi:hypothetical protein KP509_17G028900 [Ceratopteris richardii]|uniref:Uncharacterized protein n=1 Tax=Ceratopteris richardii TaxID=49495 RepID=A0A8T2SWJ9_CERRI|nr:hypothetical protein KP509_17G028900 [Ceratopteris richardii]
MLRLSLSDYFRDAPPLPAVLHVSANMANVFSPAPPLIGHINGVESRPWSRTKFVRYSNELHFFPAGFGGSKNAFKRPDVVRALGDASDAGLSGLAVFPKINEWDPYKRLGIPREASDEEIHEAHKYLLARYGGHEKSRASIESAYEKILVNISKTRRKPKINVQRVMQTKYIKLPSWVHNISNIYDVPSFNVILFRAAFFATLAIWSWLDKTRGPAFQASLSLIGCIYFLHGRLRSKWKALLVGVGCFVLSWVLGSVAAPSLRARFCPRSWSTELVTALISYFLLWFSCTFFKNPTLLA